MGRERQRGDEGGFPSSLPLRWEGRGKASPGGNLGAPADARPPAFPATCAGRELFLRRTWLCSTAPCHQQLPGSAPKPQNFVRRICLPFCGSRKTFISTMKEIINSTQ